MIEIPCWSPHKECAFLHHVTPHLGPLCSTGVVRNKGWQVSSSQVNLSWLFSASLLKAALVRLKAQYKFLLILLSFPLDSLIYILPQFYLSWDSNIFHSRSLNNFPMHFHCIPLYKISHMFWFRAHFLLNIKEIIFSCGYLFLLDHNKNPILHPNSSQLFCCDSHEQFLRSYGLKAWCTSCRVIESHGKFRNGTCLDVLGHCSTPKQDGKTLIGSSLSLLPSFHEVRAPQRMFPSPNLQPQHRHQSYAYQPVV